MKTLFGDTMEGQTLPVRLVRIFKELDLRFEVFEGEDRDWVEAAAVGIGLGYSRSSKFARLLDRHRDEFYGMGHVLEMNGLGPKVGPNSARSGRPSTIYLDAQGVIKAFMLSRAKNAKQFREWASSVLVPVLFSRGRRTTFWTGVNAKDRVDLMKTQLRMSELALQTKQKFGPTNATARILSHARAIVAHGRGQGVNVDLVNAIADIAYEKLTGEKPYPLLQPKK